LLGTVSAPLSPHVWDYRMNYKILYDRTFNVSTGWVTTATGRGIENGAIREFSINLNLHSSKSQFVAGGSTVSDGGIYMMVVSDQLNNPPVMLGTLRYIYTDA